MESDFKGYSNNGGVYKIRNITNNRIYIGSSYRFKKRFPIHKAALEANRHTNTFLQNDFNKCGTDAFIMEVIEIFNGSIEQRLKREQVYIDQYYDNQKMCYNLRKKATDTRKGKKNNEPINPLTDKRCRPYSEERKQKLKIANTEAWKDETLRQQSRDRTTKMWKEAGLEYTFTNIETGEIITIKQSLKSWCKENGYSYKAMNQLVKGRIKSSCGWYFGTEKPEYIDRKGEKRKPLSEEAKLQKAMFYRTEGDPIKFININTLQTVEFYNASAFAKEHNLSVGSVRKVISIKIMLTGNFMLYKPIYFNRPTLCKKEFTFASIMEAAQKLKLNPDKILRCCEHKQKETLGYTFSWLL